MQNKSEFFTMSLLLPDRIGILRDVTGAVFGIGGSNLIDLHQNVVGMYFSLSAYIETPAGVTADALKAAVLAALPDADKAGVAVLTAPPPSKAGPAKGERYVAALRGEDRPGWVFRAASVFAELGVNVEDWRHDGTDPKHTLTIGVVTVPADRVAELRRGLAEKFAPEGISSTLTQENIFRATNEVGPVVNLLDPSSERISRNA